MSKRSRSPELELRMNNLNRSPERAAESSAGSVSISSGSTFEVSTGNSSVSSVSEESRVGYSGGDPGIGDPGIVMRSMVLVGCPGCLMYVMLTDKKSQCPKCNSNVSFLEFLEEDGYKN